MDTLVIEHVQVSDLPAAWRTRLSRRGKARVTVRIEAETADGSLQQNPLFGLWRQRSDMNDVGAYVRKLRAPRNADIRSSRKT